MKNSQTANNLLVSYLQDFQSGSRPRGGVRGISEGVPSIGGEHLNDNGGFNFDLMKYVPEDFAKSMNKGIIQINDVLVVKDGATTGKVSFVNNDFPYKSATINEHVFLLRTNERIRPKFLFWYLWSRLGQSEILKNFQGSAQGGINRSFVDGVEVPDLSIPEQDIIIKKIDSLTPQISDCKVKITRARTLLSNFRKSVLSAAVTGKLTEEWREKKYKLINRNGLPEKWELVKLEDLNPEFQNGLAKRSGTTGDEVIVLRLADFSGFVMRKNNFRKIRLSSKEVDKYKLNRHDILIIRVNGSPQIAGKFFVFNEENLFAYCDHFIRLRVDAERISPYYLELVSGSTEARRYITDNLVSSAGQNTINQTTLKNIEILLPPLDEQEEIIRRTKSMFEMADLVENQIEIADKRTDKLTQSILAKAFRGEL